MNKKNAVRPVEVVFFDAGGTLFRPWPSVGHIYAQTALKHGVRVDAATVEKAFHEKWHLRNGMGASEVSSEKIERDWWYGFVQEVLHGSPFNDFDAFFEELYDLFARAECWRLFDDTVPALDALKAQGIRLAILSNWDHRLYSIVDQLGLKDYFEVVIASSAVGASKPSTKIFQSALAAMQASAHVCAHIGDSLSDDYEGAQKIGIKPLLIDRSERAYNGIVRLKSLEEIPGHLI